MAITAIQRVLTHDYWKLAQDIVPGDILFDRLGRPVKVRLIQQYHAQNCYEVFLKDGLTVCGDANLQLPIESEKYRKRTLEYKGKRKFTRPLDITPLKEMIGIPLTNKTNRLKFSIPTAGLLQFPTKDLPVPPFIFGFWLFNHQKCGDMTPTPGCSEFINNKFKDHGYKTKTTRRHSTNKEMSFVCSPTIQSHLIPNIPNKIPNNYLFSSPEQRLELLSGIMHAKSRQYNQKKDRFRFSNNNLVHVRQVQYLAESLGCKTSLESYHIHNSNLLNIWTKHKLMEQQTPKMVKVRQNWRLITKIQQIEPQLCVHIETDGEDSTFLVGEGFIPVC